MTIRGLITYCCFVSCAMAQAPCLTVTGDQIVGSDFARAIPAFANISPNSPLALSPLPGHARVFHLSEMQSIAARFSIPDDLLHEVCFQFAMETLNIDRVAEAMGNALQLPDARIEILETSPAAAPVGTIEFTRDDLGTPASPDSKTPVPWRGNVVYAGNRRFPISAKVRIVAPITRLVAIESLKSGVVIQADQMRTEVIDGFPVATSKSPSPERIAGMVPLRPIAAGGEIRVDNLARPNEVNRGDLVQVEVHFGAAHLALTGRAETAGRVGDTVSVRNPDTSKVFQALVEGIDRVIVGPPGSVGSRNEGD
jgi:flagella basal body P-ring formation protein FlgA